MSAAFSADTDFSALFGIDIVDDSNAVAPIASVVCAKCKGKGSFIGYSGKVIGKCFSCDGTGLERSAGVVLSADDCAKCLGTGAWRPGRPCFACNGNGKIGEVTSAAISVAKIEESFAAARGNKIKSPKLRLDTFTFSRAPDTGRNAGSIYVKESDMYLGKITSGQFQPTRDCDADTTKRIIAAAANPSSAAKAYGMRTGSCSCCGRELTNGISIDLGIGPICRDKFGWS